MPVYNYSYQGSKPENQVKCYGRELRISPKAAVEICREINGKWIDEAIDYLENVGQLKQVVPYKVYKKKVAHKKGLHRWYAGKYPQKAAKHIQKLLKDVNASAEYKGLISDNLRIVHAAAHRGIKIRGFIPRAHGRATDYTTTTTNVEIVAEERK